jgi:hypothetical protein
VVVGTGNEEKITPNKLVGSEEQSIPKKFVVYNDQLTAKVSKKDNESSKNKSTDTCNYRSSFGTEYSISF